MTKRGKAAPLLNGKKEGAEVFQLHALLENELKVYCGESLCGRLGVLRKYKDLIAKARRKAKESANKS